MFWASASSTSFTGPANWSGGSAPVNSSSFVFGGISTAANVETNLTTTLTGTTMTVEPGFTKYVGYISGTIANYLVLDGGTLKMPRATGGSGQAGSQRVMVNYGSTAATIDIDATAGSGAESFYPPVMLLGTVLTARIGGTSSVGFAVRPGEVSTLASLRTVKSDAGVPTVFLGTGVTITDATLEAGTITSNSGQTATAVRVGGATYIVEGDAPHTTLNVDSGICRYNGAGTITTLAVNGTMDLSANAAGVTITNTTVTATGKLSISNGKPGSIVFTNAIAFPYGGTLVIPPGCKALVSAI